MNGQKARRVIENMGYDTPQLHSWLEETIDEAKAELTPEEKAAFVALYDSELVGYTYLETL